MKFDLQTCVRPRLFARSLVCRIRNDSLLRNSVYIMGTNTVNAVFGSVYWIVAAHTYSTYDVGLASALISVMMLASVLSNLGIGSTLVQMLPGREAGHAWSLVLNAGVVTAIFTGLLAGIISVVALPLFSQQFAIVGHQVGYVFTLVVGVPLMTLSLLLDQTFVAERVARNMLLRNLTVAVLKILLMALPVLLLAQVGALGIFSSGVLATAVSLLGGWLLLVPRLGRAYCLATRGIVKQVRKMLSSLAGHHFINIGGLTPMFLIPVLVTVRLSSIDNAYYSITTRLSDFFFMASSAVGVALFAEGSYAAHDLLRKVRSSAVIISLLLGPAMLVLFLGGHYVMLMFGLNYAQHSILLLRLLIIAAVPDSITNIYISVLRVQKRLRSAALLNLGMALLDLTLTWILLPILGIAGTGWSFLIAQVAGSLVAGIDALRIYRQRRLVSRLQHASDQVEVEEAPPLVERGERGHVSYMKTRN